MKTRLVTLPEISRGDTIFNDKYILSDTDCLSEGEGESTYLYDFETHASWNRWLISHHCSFLLWSLTIFSLEGSHKSISNATKYINCYSEILMYTRVISPEQYKSEIRPFMSSFWPGFSALWSYEFQRLKLYINHLDSSSDPQGVEMLKSAFRFCHGNHMETAKTLVPGGRSLLSNIKKSGKSINTPKAELNYVYDCLFLIKRSQASMNDLLIQLDSKLDILLSDVTVIGADKFNTDFLFSKMLLNVSHHIKNEVVLV